MNRHEAIAMTPLQRMCLLVLHWSGWTVQGRLGGHYRPIVVVRSGLRTPASRWAWWWFVRSLPDASRLAHLEVTADPAALNEQWTELRGRSSWIACVGLDTRRKCITVHHPFRPGPYPAREARYVCRYLGYFSGQITTPPPTPAALAAEQDGF